MSIQIFSKFSSQYFINTKLLQSQAYYIWSHLDLLNKYTLNIHIYNDIRDINEHYTDKRKNTDVLSILHSSQWYNINDNNEIIPSSDKLIEKQQTLLGDVYISLDYISDYLQNINKHDIQDDNISNKLLRNLNKQGIYAIENQIPYYMIHGITHLLGYDHQTDNEFKEMQEIENNLLNILHNKYPIKYEKER